MKSNFNCGSLCVFFLSLFVFFWWNFSEFDRKLNLLTLVCQRFSAFWSAMDASSDSYIRAVQRKNGKIIIRAMLELEKVTFESIVHKICEDFNVSLRILLKALFGIMTLTLWTCSDLHSQGFGWERRSKLFTQRILSGSSWCHWGRMLLDQCRNTRFVRRYTKNIQYRKLLDAMHATEAKQQQASEEMIASSSFIEAIENEAISISTKRKQKLFRFVCLGAQFKIKHFSLCHARY